MSEKTRKKILDICKDLGYVPSTSARELSGSHKNTIAISLGPHDFLRFSISRNAMAFTVGGN
ncbi:hypothetical protein QW180_23135 [Vibrio sinaloensis]|nr:hypothetical protein [Vibrio sinaloensis]